VLPLGEREDRPDTDHLDGLELVAHPGADVVREVRVADAVFEVTTTHDEVRATGPGGRWRLRVGDTVVDAKDGTATVGRGEGR
jgi:alpha-D-xyloside xylohydrolase